MSYRRWINAPKRTATKVYEYTTRMARHHSFSILGEAIRNVDSPSKTWRLMMAYIGPMADKEHMVGLLLNAQTELIGVNTISIGTLTASLVHPREVFRPAIAAGAAALVVAHNHPSGSLTPSDDDKETTRRIAHAGSLLGIPLLDHVLCTDKGYFSFREHGLL